MHFTEIGQSGTFTHVEVCTALAGLRGVEAAHHEVVRTIRTYSTLVCTACVCPIGSLFIYSSIGNLLEVQYSSVFEAYRKQISIKANDMCINNLIAD